jgi:hypothetical protein
MRPIPMLPVAHPNDEARYFQLMALGVPEDEPEPGVFRPTAVTPPIPELIGARRFGLMAIGSIDEEPGLEREVAA